MIVKVLLKCIDFSRVSGFLLCLNIYHLLCLFCSFFTASPLKKKMKTKVIKPIETTHKVLLRCCVVRPCLRSLHYYFKKTNDVILDGHHCDTVNMHGDFTEIFCATVSSCSQQIPGKFPFIFTVWAFFAPSCFLC